MTFFKMLIALIVVAYLVPQAVQAGREERGTTRHNPLYVEVVDGNIKCR